MKYKKIGSDIICRYEIGDEIIKCLTDLAKSENITCASISGIGATNDFEMGVFNVAEKKYYKETVQGETYEIVSLNGNLTIKDNMPYVHLHMLATNKEGKVYGGHLNKAVICVTCEMFIHVIDLKLGRKVDETTTINVFDI